MVNHERWTSLAAEYENSCAKLTLIKPEIKPVFCHTLKDPVIKSKMQLRHEEYRRMMDDLHLEELHGIEQDAKGLITSYAKFKRQDDDLFVFPPAKRFKRTGAKL